MSRLFLLLILSAMLLEGCQLNLTTPGESGLISEDQRQMAASYNVQLGIAYLRQGNRIRAKKKLLKALALAPGSADLQGAMAYYFETTGDLKKADRYYQRALVRASKTGIVLNNYGVFLCRQGKYLAAERYFLRAVEDTYYLNTAGAYENAGLCAALIPDEEKASHYFIKALAQDPKRRFRIETLVDDLAKKQGNPKIKLVYHQYLKDFRAMDEKGK